MKNVIHIYGVSGSGTTTLGRDVEGMIMSEMARIDMYGI